MSKSYNATQIEEDLTSVLKELFNATATVCGEEDREQLIDLFSSVLRRKREDIDVNSEVIITRAFLDAKH